MILDSRFGSLADPVAPAGSLDHARVVEHGLFINIAHDLIVAGASGVRHVRRGLNVASTG